MSRIRKGLRRLLVGAVGSVVLGAGLVMLVLPGPAFLAIALGLGILALEFSWARTVRDRGLAWLREGKANHKPTGQKGQPEVGAGMPPRGIEEAGNSSLLDRGTHSL